MGGKPPKRTLGDQMDRQEQRRNAAAALAAQEAGRNAALRSERQRRSSSMRTLFELRGRTWVVRPLLGLALAGAAYALTRLFLH